MLNKTNGLGGGGGGEGGGRGEGEGGRARFNRGRARFMVFFLDDPGVEDDSAASSRVVLMGYLRACCLP